MDKANWKYTTIKEVKKILERKEFQNEMIKKMIDKVNEDYKEQKEQIQKKKKKK